MDTRTGQIHEMNSGESMDDFAKRMGGLPSDFVAVNQLPSGNCKRCNGTGRVKAGLFSRRFKPCKCTH